MAKPLTIAIDGPAGSGKSTTARALAKLLNYAYIDTGAMYRAVTLRTLRAKVSVEDEEAVVAQAQDAQIELKPNPSKTIVFLDDEDVSDAIRTPEVTANVSNVAKIAAVREILVAKQQEMGRQGGVILDGRDIGTVVFPNAELKIFLVASAEERARRRMKEYESQGSTDVTYEDTLAAILKRDEIDTTREASPLRQADDAVLVNTDDMTIDGQTQHLFQLAKDVIAKQETSE